MRIASYGRSDCIMDHASLLSTLPPEQRLALAYAPANSRGRILAMLALDARLAGIVRSAREPMLAQLRLAWWREQLAATPGIRPEGEPVLALLDEWAGQRQNLTALVDAWEQLLGEAPLSKGQLADFAQGRGDACAALAHRLDLGHHATEAARAGRNWALADLAARVSHPAERAGALELIAAQDWVQPRLPRSLRPLAVLHALGRRGRGGEGLIGGPGGLLVALRVGMLGF